VSWVHISGSIGGSGSGTVSYVVDANTSSISRSAAALTIAGQTFTVNQDGSPPAYEGYNDGTDCNEVWGWAWDQNAPNESISVDICYVTTFGSLFYIGTAQANLFRQDLLNAGKGNGYHAFVFNLPAQFRDGNTYNIAVVYGGTIQQLTWSPRTIRCVP
jgi:hypothetical protein